MKDHNPPPTFLSPALRKELEERWSSCSHEWKTAYSTWSCNPQGTYCHKCGANKG